MIKDTLTEAEADVVFFLRKETERAKNSGAFTEDQIINDGLMLKIALQSVAEQYLPLSKDGKEALANYKHF